MWVIQKIIYFCFQWTVLFIVIWISQIFLELMILQAKYSTHLYWQKTILEKGLSSQRLSCFPPQILEVIVLESTHFTHFDPKPF